MAQLDASALQTGCLSFDRLQVGYKNVQLPRVLGSRDRARNFQLSSPSAKVICPIFYGPLR